MPLIVHMLQGNTALSCKPPAVWADPYKRSFWHCISTNRNHILTHLIRTAISSFASSLTNQRSSILTSQDSDFWTNQITKFGSPHLHKHALISNQGWEPSQYKVLLPLSRWNTLSLSTEGVFSVFSWPELKHQRCPGTPERRRAIWADQLEQSCLDREGQSRLAQDHLTAMLLRSFRTEL